jgi:hypothetical protein
MVPPGGGERAITPAKAAKMLKHARRDDDRSARYGTPAALPRRLRLALTSFIWRDH